MAGWLIFIYLVGRFRAGARRRVWIKIKIKIKIIASILLVMAYIMVSKISIAIKKSMK